MYQVRWASDSRKFLYPKRGEFQLADCVTKEKRSTGITSYSVRWGESGDDLFYSEWKRVDDGHLVQVYRVPLSTWQPQLVYEEHRRALDGDIPKTSGVQTVPRWHQRDSDIRHGPHGGGGIKQWSEGPTGKAAVEINHRDQYLYYADKSGAKTRMFRVAYGLKTVDFPRLVLAPGGRYVLLDGTLSSQCSVFVYDPVTKQLGKLLDGSTQLYGFYDDGK